MTLKARIRKFFLPPPGAPRWRYLLPLGIFALIGVSIVGTGAYAWDYTNSPQFCGTTCHTMPPQDATYQASPHGNVYCTECHIGRAFVGEQLSRKTEDVREIYAMVFHTYEFPIRATRSQPARVTCEKCHQPESFNDNSLRTIAHYGDDEQNSLTNIYLVMKTGGGAKSQGLGRGIHWHMVNKVLYYATDPESQNIPYIRVYYDETSYTEYVDVEANIDPATIDEASLKEMDCLTCHNRVTHNFQTPTSSVDSAMSRGLIDPGIPGIHKIAVQVLSVKYASRDEAMQAIDGVINQYKNTDYYAGHEGQISLTVEAIKDIYDLSIFPDQKVDWTTYPNNIGHINTPGCFRCHDGKHLDSQDQAIRLECNLCHSIPVVAGEEDFVTNIEISRGLEPESHLNPNWISLHNEVFDDSCANCHTMDEPGGVSNTSFCSNSACHGNVYTYAGFDAPELRAILQAQLPPPTPTPTPAPVVDKPTYDANIAPLFQAHCTKCHGTAASAGLKFNTYADAMKGSKNGVVILPGDSANSMLVQVQNEKHFGQFTAEELALVIEWIDAGAPEK